MPSPATTKGLAAISGAQVLLAGTSSTGAREGRSATSCGGILFQHPEYKMYVVSGDALR